MISLDSSSSANSNFDNSSSDKPSFDISTFNSAPKKLVTTTLFSEIYSATSADGKTALCVKSVSKSAPKPHSSKREIAILKSLTSHENIIPLLSTWEDANDAFIVMPFYEKTLSQILIPFWKPLKKKKTYLSTLLHNTVSHPATISEHDFYINTTPKDLILKVTKDLFEGFSFLHENNIMHRDVKMDNILYDSARDNFVIIDFGISCVFDGETAHDQVTDIATGYYKPVEALLGIKHYDLKIDVWCVMVLLQQLSLEFICCYDIPFSYYCDASKKGNNTQSWIHAICEMNLESDKYELNYNHTMQMYNFPSLIRDGRTYSDGSLSHGSDIKLLSTIHSIFGCPLQKQFPSAKNVSSWIYFFNNMDKPSDKYFVDDEERQLFMQKVLFGRFGSAEFAERCLFKMCLFEFTERVTFAECLEVFRSCYIM